MEMIEKKVVKLDEEERENLINTIKLMERIEQGARFICGENCPFKAVCDNRSDLYCFFEMMVKDLKYINNNCD